MLKVNKNCKSYIETIENQPTSRTLYMILLVSIVIYFTYLVGYGIGKFIFNILHP